MDKHRTKNIELYLYYATGVDIIVDGWFCSKFGCYAQLAVYCVAETMHCSSSSSVFVARRILYARVNKCNNSVARRI